MPTRPAGLAFEFRSLAPFIALQLLGPALIFFWAPLVTWLPAQAR